jgi:hypothetical protein
MQTPSYLTLITFSCWAVIVMLIPGAGKIHYLSTVMSLSPDPVAMLWYFYNDPVN